VRNSRRGDRAAHEVSVNHLIFVSKLALATAVRRAVQPGEASTAPPSAGTSTNSAAQEGGTRTLTLSVILASDFR